MTSLRLTGLREVNPGLHVDLAERLTACLIYLAAVCVLVLYGVILADRSAVTGFARNYLEAWNVAAIQYRAAGGKWPVFNAGGRQGYMAELSARMKAAGISLPRSNLKVPWKYRLGLLTRKAEEIYLVVLPGKTMIYGLSAASASALDKVVDRKLGGATGQFLVPCGRNERQVVVTWLR